MIRDNNSIVIPEKPQALSGIQGLVSAAAAVMLLLAPQVGTAQNECGAGTTVECDDASYPTGITYNSSADLTVTKTHTGDTTIDANGINLTGTGSAAVTWDSQIGGIDNLIGGDATGGPVLDVLTGSGDIDIRTRGIDGTADTVTHGIRARSTGGGSILINDRYEAAFGDPNAEIRANAASGIAGIEAATSGGDGDVEILFGTGGDDGRPGAVEGSQYGILASAEGSGDLTIRGDTRRGGGLDGIFQTRITEVDATGGGAIAGIHATTGTGTLDIFAAADGGAGSGVIVDAGGDVVFTGQAFGDQYGIDLLNVAAGTTSTLNIAGGHGGVALARAQGDGAVVVNMTSIIGLVNLGVIERLGTGTAAQRHRFENLNFDFNGLADTAQVNITGEAIWRVQDLSATVPDNNFNVFIRETGGLRAGLDPSTNPTEVEQFQGAVVIDFEGADRLLVNEGFIAIGPELQQAEVRLEGLAEFRHSGRILMGSSPSQAINFIGEPRQFLAGDLITNRTDSRADDVLAVPDANWVGEGGEIWMDVDFSGGQSQNSCERNADGDLPAADCLELHGATTSGVTYLTLADPLAFDRGRLVEGQEIVLVDVSGGDSAQGHFVIGPNTPSYSPLFGGSWDRGLFQYVVGYNQDTQQHILSGMPNHGAYQQAQLAATAHDLWRTSTATSLDRQADLRDRGADETGGLWLRVSNETADRDVVSVEQVGTEDFPFDNSFSRDSYALTFGLDFLTGGSGDSAWMLGFMGGYANADVEYNASVNSAELNGWSLGGYAGYTAGDLWVDAAVNLNELTLRQHIPGLNLIPQETLVSNDLRSVGAQVDAGWRFDLTRAIFVEPLASLSYVSTSFDTLNIKPDDPSRPGLALDWNDPTSLRAGLGGRVGTNYDLGFMRGQLSLAAKVWNESDGESVVSIHNNAYPDDPDVEAKDTFDDTVTEVTLGASVRSPGNAVSGFINLGGATASDYDAFTAKLGVRYQW